jgi:hypothetical protein
VALGLLERDVVSMRQRRPQVAVGALAQLRGDLVDDVLALTHAGRQVLAKLGNIAFNEI